jgi:hypothetical protein
LDNITPTEAYMADFAAEYALLVNREAPNAE